MKIENELLEEKLKAVLNQVCEESAAGITNGNKSWTKRIKELICSLGTEVYGIGASTGGFAPAFDPEWLYDVTWYQNQEEEPHMLLDIPLVVESEWSHKFAQVKYDFEKLLVARAGLRLMICQVRVGKSKEYLFDYFQKAVETCKLSQKGDRYLIAIYDDHIGFEYRSIIKE